MLQMARAINSGFTLWLFLDSLAIEAVPWLYEDGTVFSGLQHYNIRSREQALYTRPILPGCQLGAHCSNIQLYLQVEMQL